MNNEPTFTDLERLCATMAGYGPLAARTCSPNFNVYPTGDAQQVHEAFRSGTPAADSLVNLVHAAFGITGEARELRDAMPAGDAPNALEECGDAYWYEALVHQWLDEQRVAVPDWLDLAAVGVPLTKAVDEYDRLSHDFQNTVKRLVFYKKDYDLSVLAKTQSERLAWLDEIVRQLGSTPVKVRATNVNKLRLRFADAYTDVAALVRNLPAEGALLVNAFQSTDGKQ